MSPRHTLPRERRGARANTIALLALLLGLGFWTGSGCGRISPRSNGTADRAPASSTPERRATVWLSTAVVSWHRENGCFSCHNNGDAARALHAALRAGVPVETNALGDTWEWLSHPQQWKFNKGDPGFSDFRLANIQFAAALQTLPSPLGGSNTHAYERAADLLLADQAPDGAWPVEPQNPLGSPATYGTALATTLAHGFLARLNRPSDSRALAAAAAWLDRLPPVNTPNLAVALLRLQGPTVPAPDLAARRATVLARIRNQQTSDGGWGPYPDSPAEVWDTALVLLGLAAWKDQPEVGHLIRRGRAFLESGQEPDGSWAATTRPSGGNSYAQRVSTTGWALLALLATRNEKG